MAVRSIFLCVILLSIIINGNYASVLIVPEDILSVIRTAIQTIPKIFKGTDSRVGFGFALGNHADVQVMLELGPQSNTAPVGSSFRASSKQRRRSVLPAKAQELETSTADNDWRQTDLSLAPAKD